MTLSFLLMDSYKCAAEGGISGEKPLQVLANGGMASELSAFAASLPLRKTPSGGRRTPRLQSGSIGNEMHAPVTASADVDRTGSPEKES